MKKIKSFFSLILGFTLLFSCAALPVHAANADASTGISAPHVLKIRFFSCERDGLRIKGLYFLPSGVKNEKVPAVIISHGFGSNMLFSLPYALRFAKRGYASFIFDFCGSGSGISEGKSTDMSVLTEKEDLSAVLDYVRAFDGVDANRVTLAGCSQGGMVSALLAAERPDDVSSLMLYYPALCIPDDARRGNMLGAKFDPENVPDEFTALFVKLSAKYALDAQSLEPWAEIKTYEKPVLLCHGTKDTIVDLSYAEKAAQEYADCQLEIIEGAGHGFFFKGLKESIHFSEEFLAQTAVAP